MANHKEPINDYQAIVFKRLQREIKRQNKSIIDIVTAINDMDKAHSGAISKELEADMNRKSDSVVRRCLKDIPGNDKKFSYDAVLKIALALNCDVNALFSEVSELEQPFLADAEKRKLIFGISYDNLTEEQHNQLNQALTPINSAALKEWNGKYGFNDVKYENHGRDYYGYTLNPTKTNGEIAEFSMNITGNTLSVRLELSECQYMYTGQLNRYRNTIWSVAFSDKGPGIFVLKYIEHNGGIQYRRGHLIMSNYVNKDPVAQDFIVCKEPIQDRKKKYLGGILKLGVSEFYVKKSEINRLSEEEKNKIFEFFDRFDIKLTADNSYLIKEAAIMQIEIKSETDKERRIEYVKSLLLLKSKAASSISKLDYGYEEYIHETVKYYLYEENKNEF